MESMPARMAEFLPSESIPSGRITQAGAVPYRVGGNGVVQVCLLTSSLGLWGLPKGTIEPGESPEETAVTETYEEAGLIGVVAEPALGVWRYLKGRRATYVKFYALLVTDELDHWLEDHRRERRWVSLTDAPGQIERGGMDDVVLALRERLACASA